MPLSLARLLSRAAAGPVVAMEATTADAAAAAAEALAAAAPSASLAAEPTGDPLVDVAAFLGASSEACAAESHAAILAARSTLEATVKLPVMGIGRVRDLFDALAASESARIRSSARVQLAEAKRQLSLQAERYESELAITEADDESYLHDQPSWPTTGKCVAAV